MDRDQPDNGGLIPASVALCAAVKQDFKLIKCRRREESCVCVQENGGMSSIQGHRKMCSVMNAGCVDFD